MPTQSSHELASAIRRGELSRVYYLYGSDHVRVKQLSQTIAHRATGSNDADAITRFDGQKLDIALLTDAAAQFSMFSPYNCLLITDLNADKLTDTVLKQFLALIKDLGDATVIIIAITGFDPKDGRRSIPAGKTKKLVDAITKCGIVCEATQPSDAELARQITQQATKAGCTLENKTARYLVDAMHGDTLTLQNEMDKLIAAAGNGGTITPALVDALSLPRPETTSFKLADAVLGGNVRLSMTLLGELFAMRTSRGEILYTIANAFLHAYRASAAMHAGKSPQDVKTDFGYRFAFQVDNAFQSARAYSPEHIRRCIVAMRDLELTLNSTATDERILLETTILKLLQRR